MVDFSPFLIMWRCTIVLLIGFSRWLLIRFSVSPGQVFRKSCLVGLKRLASVELKSAAWRYCDSSGLVVWTIMLFATISDCCVSRITSHIPICLFQVTLTMCCPIFWTDISCLSCLVHPSSHKTPNYISDAVLIFGVIWICLACLLRPGICSVAMCDESIVLPSGSLAVISF